MFYLGYRLLCLTAQLPATASAHRSSTLPIAMASPANIPAYILCGGRSQRLGTDKARSVIDGQPQLVKLGTALSQAGHRVYYVADRADRFNDLGITCLVDQYNDSG